MNPFKYWLFEQYSEKYEENPPKRQTYNLLTLKNP